MITKEFNEELKARIDIADVISSYVPLKKSGRNLVGLCPFHNERSPSFSVMRENGFFHCFGCGAGGDVITFIQKIENLDYVDAVKLLAQRAGIEVPEDASDSGMGKLKNRIYEANREAARFFHRMLYSPDGKQGLDYLRKRGLTEKTIIHFGLGYSPKDRFALVNHLQSKGFSKNEIVQANLANVSKNGHSYDRFSDRVMFPIIDMRGNVIAFGGRIMSDIKPKYLNTSDTPVFNKSRNLYSLQFAKKKANGQLILVEGYMDVIALHQAGFENAVATLGTALTDDQAKIIKRYSEEVVICYDADEAGQKATQRAIGILRPMGMRVKVLTVPNGKDPDEFMRSYGEQGSSRFRMLLEKSGNDFEYRMSKLRSQFNTEIPEQKVEFLTKAAGLLSELENPVEQDVYISQLSRDLEVDKNAIRQLVEKNSRRHYRQMKKQEQRAAHEKLSGVSDNLNREKRSNLRAASAEEALISMMIYDPDVAIKIAGSVTPDIFVTSTNRRIFEMLKKRVDNGEGVEPDDLSGYFTADEMEGIVKMLVSHQREKDPYAAAEAYTQILVDQSTRITPEKAAEADNDAIMEELRKKKERKRKPNQENRL